MPRDYFPSPFESLFGDDPFQSFFKDFSPTSARQYLQENRALDVSRYLSNESQGVLQKAALIAQANGRDQVNTSHLLAALLEDESMQVVWNKLKVKPQEWQEELGLVKSAPAKELTDKYITVEPQVKSVLLNAIYESQEMGYSFVGPEHFLLSLCGDEGRAGDVIRSHNLSPHDIRRAISTSFTQTGVGAHSSRESRTPKLDQYSRDLTELARQNRLDPVIGRTDEIETTIEILSRRTKNNPVLIGEPGVGKTAIAEGLAQRIVSGDVPETLQDKRVIELNLNSLIAGSKYRGEFEGRLQGIIDEIKSASDSLVLFIDEIHTIVGAGSSEGGMDIANVFKPVLARGELNLVGATTLNEYQKHIEKDAALERRFQPVFIDEPTVEQTIMILQGLRDRYEAHHKVSITDNAIVAAANLSERYITNRFLPDKAIDLIDQAAARVRIASMSAPRELREVEREIERLERDISSATARKDTATAGKLQRRLDKLQEKRSQQAEKWREQKQKDQPQVEYQDIAEIISRQTGIPVAELSSEEKQRLVNLETKLHERVVGQEEAVTAVANAIRRSRAGLGAVNRPVATFLFLGPTGVGKTELAKTIAWAIFGDESALLRIDMSEYSERHAVARLIGAPPGYVGYEEGGQLTEAVRRRPYQVVLLDEIEKAHPDAYNILLQLLDEGRLTDGKGRIVDFTNTIIVATSNIASDKIQAASRANDDFEETKRTVVDELRNYFRPEFINRLDEVIVFGPLSKEQIRGILELELVRIQKLAAGQSIEVEFSDALTDHLLDAGYSPEYGARELKRTIRQELENKLANAMLNEEVHSGDKVLVDYARGDISFKKAQNKKSGVSKKK